MVRCGSFGLLFVVLYAFVLCAGVCLCLLIWWVWLWLVNSVVMLLVIYLCL